MTWKTSTFTAAWEAPGDVAGVALRTWCWTRFTESMSKQPSSPSGGVPSSRPAGDVEGFSYKEIAEILEVADRHSHEPFARGKKSARKSVSYMLPGRGA